MALSDNIKYLRISSELSQPEFGKLFGVTDKAVSTWENGSRVPRMGVIQKIADYYDIKTSDIIDGNISQKTSSNTVQSIEPTLLKKYRTLDEYGKKAVDAILDIEYERVMSESKEYLAAARNGQRVRANRVDNIDDLLPPASEDPTNI